MMYTRNTMFHRVLALVLSVLLVAALLPVRLNGVAVEPEAPAYGTVTTYTGGTVTGSGTADVQVLVEETTLPWWDANDLRAEGWWAGIDMIAPEGYSAEATLKVKYGDGEFGTPLNFADVKDSDTDVQLWMPVTVDALKAGKDLVRTYIFDWDADGNYEQTVTFTVRPSNKIVLMKGEEQVYPVPVSYGTVTTYTGGTITGNGTADVQVLVEETTLPWWDANDLRAEGWWAGIDMIAPEGYSAAATLKVKYGDGEFGTPLNFADVKDSDTDVQLWMPVTVDALKEGKDLVRTYIFDWDADGDYEQTVTFTVRPSNKIVLMKGEEQIYPVVYHNIEVTETPDEGGKVLLNGTEAKANNEVERKSNVTIRVEANEGYRISTITINDTESPVNAKSFEVSIENLTADASFVVTYVKLYTITIEGTGNGGVLVKDKENQGGTLTVVEGTEIEITATPHEHHRVTKVVINDVVQEITVANDAGYTGTITANQKYTIQVTFAANVYEVTAENDGNGSVTVETQNVSHGDSAVVTIHPAAGYTVDTYTIESGTATLGDIGRNSDGTIQLTLNEVQSDVKIKVTFKETAKAALSEVEQDTEQVALRVNGDKTLYVVAENTLVTFAPKNTEDSIGIRVRIDGLEEAIGGIDQSQIEVAGGLTINSIELYYQAEGELYADWHVVEMSPIAIVTDTQKPTITITPDKEPVNDYYSQNIVLAADICDEGDYSGIHEVRYQISYRNGKEKIDGEWLNIPFTPVGIASVSGGIPVDAIAYNYPDVFVTVVAIDLAGNESESVYTLHINSTQPKFQLSMDGKSNDTAYGKNIYFTENTLTIAIKDRDDTFVASNATAGLAVTKDEQPYELSENAIEWNYDKERNAFVGTYTFTENGYYKWSYSYENLAGVAAALDDSVANTEITDFIIDNGANRAPVNLQISYKASVLGTIVEAITFGLIDGEDFDYFFFGEDVVTVTLSATDDVSGIQKFIYTYTAEAGCEYINAGLSEEQVITFEDEGFVQVGNGATATFDIPAQFRGRVSFKAVDMAGWESEWTDQNILVVDTTNPVVNVTFDTPEAIHVENCFDGEVTATITITEDNFFPGKLDSEKLDIQVNGKKYTDKFTFEKVENTNNVYQAQTTFTDDGKYTFAISYTDRAGNAAPEYTPYAFIIDKTAPEALDITIRDQSVKNKTEGSVAFNTFYDSAVRVLVSASDATSGIHSLQYQKVTSLGAYNEDGNWTDYNAERGVVVKPSEKFILFVRAEDNAGNVTIVNSTGIVVDDKQPVGETQAPEIDILTTKPNEHGYHNGDVSVDVKVVDPKYAGETASNNGYYSGLNKITYKIYATDTKQVEEGVLFDKESKSAGAQLDEDELVKAWSGSFTIDADIFNSNNVIVEITAIDNAGNQRISTTKKGDIQIDITPAKIAVTYNNNDGDTSFGKNTYFKANRTATIVVTERNFDPSLFKLELTNTDGAIPTISAWTTKKGSGNGDATTHTARIVFNKDGDYTMAVSCVDKALNPNQEPDTKNSLAPWAFTIDKTIPVVRVSYNNNDVRNGNYYKDQRTATITVTEHNFETGRVQVSLQATDDGAAVALPTISRWTSNGDVHTATITYAADALYTFDFDYTDKAGNKADNMAEQVFYVDNTNPTLKIEKIVDRSANNAEGNIGFVMTAYDTNFDGLSPVITAVVKDGNGFKTEVLKVGNYTDIKNGQVYTVDNLDADGIYRITCTVVDKSGRAYSEVTLEAADGSTYVEQRNANDTLVTFSVNRNGSTYEIDAATNAVLEKYYVQQVENDVVIHEINADPLQEFAVTLNGKELTKDADYTVTEEGGNGDWMKYTYTVNKALFADEGEYKLVVSSKDKANNDAFSDVKEAAIEFVVDRTKPVVTISGIAEDGRYQTTKQQVTLIPTDDGGALNTLIVNLVDENGKVLKEVINLAGDALLNQLETNDGKITFELAEGLYQNVQVICTDCATGGSEETNTHDTTVKNVSVSSSVFMIFWANKTLRWGTIGGVSAALIALAVFIILKQKKRKAE